MKLPIIALLLLVTGGCSIFPNPQQPPAMHDFGFVYSGQSSKVTTPTQETPISVEAPKWLIDNRIHYRLLYANPTQVRFYTLDRWIAPPPELFAQLLNSSGKHWVAPALIQLNVFEQQFVSSSQSKVVMDFTVSTVPGNKSQQSIQQDFHLQSPCPTPDAKGAVIGFTVVTREASEKIAAWLIEIH
jgi:cholesterol transport system auxiliary component